MPTNLRNNAAFLKGLCVVLPAMTLVAAHYLPWKQLLNRDLHQLEAYVVGTAAIAGTAGFSISISEGDRDDHVVMLALAVASAGISTISAHVIDHVSRSSGKIANLEAQIQALKNNANNL